MEYGIKVKFSVDGTTRVVDATQAVSAGVNELAGDAKKAAQKMREVGAEMGAATAKMTDDAKKAAQQMRQVAPQFTDIVTQLAGGQSPLLVLMQQGGQLMDVFGGVGPAAKALTGYITGLISPLTVAGAAVAGLAAAMYVGNKQTQDFSNAIILSGNQVGLSNAQYRDAAVAIAGMTGSQGAALAALGQTASGAKLSADMLQRVTATAIQLEQVAGKSVASTVEEFAALAKDPVEASVKLTDKYNYLTAAVYTQIKALKDQGRETDAVKLAQEAYARGLEGMRDGMVNNIGSIEKGWIAVKKAVAGVVDAMAGLGRAQSGSEQRQALLDNIAYQEKQRALAFAQGRDVSDQVKVSLNMARQELAILDSKETMERENARLKADQQEKLKAAVAAETIIEGSKSKQAKYAAEALRITNVLMAAGRTEAIPAALAHARETILGNNTFNAALEALKAGNALAEVATKDHIDRLQNEYKRGALSQIESIEAVGAAELAQLKASRAVMAQELAVARQKADGQPDVARLVGALAVLDKQIALQPEKTGREVALVQYNAALKYTVELESWRAANAEDTARADREAEARYQAAKAAVDAYGRSIKDEAEEIAFQTGLLGQNADAQARAIALRKVRIEQRKQEKDLDARSAAGNLTADQKAAEEARIATLAGQAGANAQAQVYLDKWRSTYTTISDGLTDALMEGGKAGGQRLVDMFKRLVLRPVVSALVSPVAAGLTGAMGLAGTANAAQAGSSGLGLLGNVGTLASLGGSFGAGAASGFSALMSGGGVEGVAAAVQSGVDLIAQGLAGEVAGGMAAGFGTLAGALGPIALGIALLPGLIDSMFGGGTDYGASGIAGRVSKKGFTGSAFQDWASDGGWFGSDSSGTNYSDLSASAARQLNKLSAGLMQSASTAATALGLSTTALDNFTADVRVQLVGDTAKDQAALAAAFADVGNTLAQRLLPKVADFAKDGESAGDTLARLSSTLTGTNGVLQSLRLELLANSVAGAAAASALVDLFGSVDALTSASKAYYDAFYSDAERATLSTQNMGTALAALGIALPATKAQYRALVESLDLTTSAGQLAYRTLMGLAPEYAATAQLLEQQAQDAAAALLAQGKQLTATLSQALADVDVSTFVGAMAGVLDDLAGRLKTVLDAIASERQQVTSALSQVQGPTTLTAGQIGQQLAGINTALPSNAGLLAASATLTQAQTFATTYASLYSAASAAANGPAMANWLKVNAGTAGTATTAPVWARNDGTSATASGFSAQLSTPEQLAASMATRVGNVSTWGGKQYMTDQMLQPVYAAVAYLQQAGGVSTVADAQAAAQQATLDYTAALSAFTADAGKSVAKLTELRTQTVAYYQQQKALADLMGKSASGLRQTVTDYRTSQLQAEQQYALLAGQFNSAYSMALSTGGDVLAGYGDKLAALVNPLLQKAADAGLSDLQYQSLVATVLARANAIADKLEATAPVDYQAQSVDLLGQIDVTLAALDASTQSAERVIADAVKAGSDRTAAGLGAVIAAITGQTIPAFALGGDHAGGIALVGERGPELVNTGPARVFTAAQTRGILGGSGDNSALLAELRGLRSEVVRLRAEAQATAVSNARLARLAERTYNEGQRVFTDSDTPLATVAA